MTENGFAIVPAQTKITTGKATTIAVSILDESGSMEEYGNTPPEAMDAHHEALRKCDDGRQYLCAVITFASDNEVKIPLMPVEDFGMLEGYRPHAMTLLWETVNKTINDLLNFYRSRIPTELRDDTRVVIGVFSDGDDNESDKSLQPEALQAIAAEAQSLGWELLTFGIGIDAKELAKGMGFPTDDEHAVTVVATPQGVRDATMSMTQTSMGGFKPRDL